MAILRIATVQTIDSSNIDVTFTDTLATNLVPSNVTITSETPNAPSSEVLQVAISGRLLSITCQPLTPLVAYSIKFQSVTNHPFTSIHGDSKIQEDGISNVYLISAPLEPENPIKNYLSDFLQGNIYNNTDDTTIVAKYIKGLSVALSKALYDIGQVKNENYLSFNVIDEHKIRGAGPFDRLEEEGAYEVLRVGATPSGVGATTTFLFDSFPSYPVTLQREVSTEVLTANSVDEAGFFNINSLVLNLGHAPVTKVKSIVFTFNTANPIYVYNIPNLGYQILNSRYSQDFGFTYLQLEDNQIRINDVVLSDPLFTLDKLIRVDVEYEYKNLGIVVDPTTVEVYTTENATREVIDPIVNIFTLDHAPITDSGNNIPTLGGAIFIDPNNNTGLPHPAFKYEIPFRLNAMPSSPGQYAVDYATGTVYVFGSDLNNDGTGPFPPLVTYKYRLIYSSEVDYVYDADFQDLVALPTGSLVNFSGQINFGYEQVYIPGVDYVSAIHQESLTERIGNRLVALNAFKTQNSPITNVFKIYNETSGEIYTLNRWNDNKVYFRYNNPPRLLAALGERISFNQIMNELLFINSTITTSTFPRIFKILLNNNTLVGVTEDSIGTSFNSSVVFSNGNVFVKERWFNRDFSEAVNLTRLSDAGDYMVDYVSGIVYVAVSTTQGSELGTVTYRNDTIVPQFPHVIAVDDLFYRLTALGPKNKIFSYTSFGDGFIEPETLDFSDESYLNNTTTAPYIVINGKVGSFVNTTFVPGVSNQVKFTRFLGTFDDLLNSTNPFNFSPVTTSSGFNISVGTYSKEIFQTVQQDIDGYYVTINENIPYLSSSITYSFSATRDIDGYQLFNGSLSNVKPGDPVKLILTQNLPNVGDQVTVIYSLNINSATRVVVDYNKGDYFADYTYLADEIIISYEYGDNVLDFRRSNAVPEGTEYYASYKAGALRDALLKNFGTLVSVTELATFDVDFNRERYRDALIAAMTSFIQGPTITAIKNIAQTISHIEPEIIESAFLNWSLGTSSLSPESITTTGEFELFPAKFGNGVMVNKPDQTINFPVNSNIRFNEGTFETWVIPQWDGLDNDANLTFTILKNGTTIPSNFVFVGAAENHPEINDGSFTLGKLDNVVGTPNTNKNGVYIYYDKDISGNFFRWYIRVIDGYAGVGNSANYKFTIKSTGNFYDNKSLKTPKPSNLTVFTGNNTLNISITGGGFGIDEGVTFLSDLEHYLLDFGNTHQSNRLSIYKDVSGYLNFRVYDQNGIRYAISADVSGWQSGQVHQVAASWKLNTFNQKDEMHLFIDGFEVPNIIKYGQRLAPYLHEKFRTVNPEEIIGLSNRDIVGSTDLSTISGSSLVTSSINFSSFQIFPGDKLFIDQAGFDSAGYTILTVNGQNLTLTVPMPVTLTNGKFSVNRTNFTVTSDIDVVPNIAVTTISAMQDGYINGTDMSGTLGSNVVTSLGSNFLNAKVLPGYILRINNNQLSITYTILAVTATTLTIDDTLPINFSGQFFQIYTNTENEISGVRAIRPSYSIFKDGYFNNILTVSNNVFANDLILVRTLGLNHKKVKRQYYVWSDQKENILMTQLPPPISLDEAKIIKVIMPPTFVGPSNSTFALGIFNSPQFPTYPPSNQQNGRTITAYLSGNNADFTTPVQVTLNGQVGINTISETITFTDYGPKDFTNLFMKCNYVTVTAKPLNSSKNAVTVELKEKFTMTYSENSGYVPVVRYSYQIGAGTTLYQDGYDVFRDDNFLFSNLDINNYLIIHSPPSVAGYYVITGLSVDRHAVTVQPTNAAAQIPLPSFTNGTYQVLNTTGYRNGLQNGYFTFEARALPSQAYFLDHGPYELEYFTYTAIPIKSSNGKAFLGSDLYGHCQFNGIIDEMKIYSVMLTDTRIGEALPENQCSITKDFNSLKPLKADSNTLMLVEFDYFPFTNIGKFYINSKSSKDHFQSSVVINENFGNSLVILNKPLILDNDGILDTQKQGTIEFWVSPMIDTGNDPTDRYYFDAFGAVIEDAVSVTNSSVKISAPASQILSVKLKAGDPRIDYFAGGKIEIDTQHAVQEESTSISNTHCLVTEPILQVISVKIIGDQTGTDYFANGSIGSDQLTIFFGKALPQSNLDVIVTYQTTANKNVLLNSQIIRLNSQLPYQNTKVQVRYIPQGLQGDRISIFKDKFGFVNFAIRASNQNHVIRGPTRWVRNTWHRIKAQYKMNGGVGQDEIRLFLDGYEWSNLNWGSGPVYNQYPFVFGSSAPGNIPDGYDGYGLFQTIKFKDPINNLFIGSQYSGEGPIYSLIDNFRVSNVSRPIYAPFGEPIDVNWGLNLNVVSPVTNDLFTTYLMDFNSIFVLNNDFAILKNRLTGNFDFTVNVLDSFGIIQENIKSQEALEALIKVLKPANSRVFIQYIR